MSLLCHCKNGASVRYRTEDSFDMLYKLYAWHNRIYCNILAKLVTMNLADSMWSQDNINKMYSQEREI